MKRITILAFCVICAVQTTIAQEVPQGMKYQAVARDNSGEVLANQQIGLRVSLHGDLVREESFYAEEHSVVTNKLGLFTLTIGEGMTDFGLFEEVPWSTRDVWMRVEIRRGLDNQYAVISESRMLSVPYAFHAATASRLIEEATSGRGPVPSGGVKSEHWALDGNLASIPGSPDFHKLGTMDQVDLVVVTNQKERMRFFADEFIEIWTSVFMEDSLTVRQSVDLNMRSGQTRNHGPFTVTRSSPTLLTGTLDVDGATTLNNSLTVTNQSPTLLTGTLEVDGTTDLNDRLRVNNQSPSILTGTLMVDGATSLNDKLTVFNQSPTLLSGTLTVDLATDINSSLNVDGMTNLNSALFVNNAGPTLLSGKLTTVGNAIFNEHVTLDNATYNSFSKSDGALVVAGGVGIGKNINVGGNAKFEGDVGIEGPLKLTDPTPSTSTTTGALIVSGGVGLAKDIYVGGKMDLDKDLSMRGKFSLITDGGSNHVASFENTNNGSGISIKVGAPTPHNNNNFITFYNQSGNIVGRIEGEDGSADLANNREYNDDIFFKSTAIALSATSEVIAIAEEIQAIVAVVAAATSSTACVGLGVCVTAPIPSFIISEAANLIVATASLIVQTVDLGLVIADLVSFENTHEALFGITFASGAEDYAEYLPKYDVNEKFIRGDVVGMRHGMITKNTHNAERIMVISHNPAMLGGLPHDGNKSAYEMVAFMGQIPTRVMGPVKPGDYILPSGYHNGFGIARSPKDMKPEDYKNVLGIAWEGAEGMKTSIVNVAIGLNTNDMADLIGQLSEKADKQDEQIRNLQKQIQETNTILAQLVPGFKEAANIEGEFDVAPALRFSGSEETVAAVSNESYEHDPLDRMSADNVVYFEATSDELEAAFVVARNAFEERGVDLSEHPFWKRIDSEPAYKEEVKQDLLRKIKTVMHTHRELNEEWEGR